MPSLLLIIDSLYDHVSTKMSMISSHDMLSNSLTLIFISNIVQGRAILGIESSPRRTTGDPGLSHLRETFHVQNHPELLPIADVRPAIKSNIHRIFLESFL